MAGRLRILDRVGYRCYFCRWESETSSIHVQQISWYSVEAIGEGSNKTMGGRFSLRVLGSRIYLTAEAVLDVSA